jgi:hypothetical protein
MILRLKERPQYIEEISFRKLLRYKGMLTSVGDLIVYEVFNSSYLENLGWFYP